MNIFKINNDFKLFKSPFIPLFQRGNTRGAFSRGNTSGGLFQRGRIAFVFAILLIVSGKNVYSETGWDYFFSNKYNTAIKAFENDLGQKEKPDVFYGLALTYLRYGQLNDKFYKQTLLLESRYYNVLLALENKDVKQSNYVHYYLGVNQMRLGKYDEAISSLSTAMNNPIVSPTYRGLAKIALGECYFGKGMIDKAKQNWEAIESATTSDKLLGSELAAVYASHEINMPQMLKLVQQYDLSSRATRQLDRFWHNIGWVYYKNGDIQKALESFSRANMKFPDFVERINEKTELEFYTPICFKYRAVIYFAESISFFEKLDQEDQTRFRKKPLDSKKDYKGDIAYNLALCYLAINKPDNAIASLKTINNNFYTNILLARVYYEKKQTSLAESEWSKNGINKSRDTAIMLDLAYTYSLLGIKQKEVQQLMKLVGNQKLNESSLLPCWGMPLSDSFRRAGIANLNIGNRDNALELFEKTRNKMYKNNVGSLSTGNDPLLLLDLAFTYYLKGFNSYPESTATYLAMEKFYPESRQMINLMQGIFGLWPYINGGVKDKLLCEKYSLFFG